MSNSFLYRDGSSALHRLDPGIKLCLLAWVVCSLFVFPWQVLLVADAVLLAWSWSVQLGRFISLRLLVMAGPFALALLWIHGTLLPAADRQSFPVLSWHLNYSPTGIGYALVIASRFITLLCASLLFVVTTHPLALLRSLEEMGVPASLSYLLTSPLLLIEQFSRRSHSIRDSQQTRGMNIQGSWLTRLKSLPSLFVPLVTLALSDTGERARVLEARGFRSLTRQRHEPSAEARRRGAWRKTILAVAVLQVVIKLCL